MEPTRPANYLFLQGPASLFFSKLAAALQNRGHQVRRINFNGGDRVFWRHPGAVDYLGDECGFSSFLLRRFVDWSITDIVLLGDCRPLHRLTIELARFVGVTTHIFEEGYIRPNWITLEHSGVNGFSSLPLDFTAFLSGATQLDAVPQPVEIPSRLPRRAVDDVIYSISTLLMRRRFANFKRHWPYSQVEEYYHGGRRLVPRLLKTGIRGRQITKLAQGATPYYVFPMQVDADSQIVFHSQFRGQSEAITLILASFATQAPNNTLLVVTEHPLDTSPTDWKGRVMQEAETLGVSARVLFLRGGSPRELLASCSGVVVINSTTGYQALELGVPVIALSPAVFNLSGLTYQDGLDRFWAEAQPAPMSRVNAFKKVIVHQTQLNGGFFTNEGIKTAVVNAVPRMEAVSARQNTSGHSDKSYSELAIKDKAVKQATFAFSTT